jgi:hypothetical protein
MPTIYPFSPKSNKHLQPGHFWPIKLSNGKFACGIVLDVPGPGTIGTKMFLAGLLDWTGDQKPSQEELGSTTLKILDQGNAHIKTIFVQHEAIEGCIALENSGIQIEEQVLAMYIFTGSKVMKGYNAVRTATPEDHSSLSNRSTWGYGVIYLCAERLLTNTRAIP